MRPATLPKAADFSVVLFRLDFVLVSEKNHMKVHKNQCIGPCHIPPNALLELPAEGKPQHLEAQKPAQ
jgi:hypothetical protein